MTRIVVSPELLEQLSVALTEASGSLAGLKGQLSQAMSNLDWQVRERNDVEQHVTDSQQANDQLAGTAQALSAFLAQKARAFAEADQQGAAGLATFAGSMAQGGGTNGVTADSGSGATSPATGVPEYGFHIDSQAFLNATEPERMQMLMPAFKAMEQKFKVPWQIQAAQWAIESGWGGSRPTDMHTHQESYNMFGIKGKGPAGSVECETGEHLNGKDVRVVDHFKAYNSFEESVVDHAEHLAGEYYRPAQDCKGDLRCWCEQLGPKHLGYATSPSYPDTLWNFMKSEGWVK
jgi:flagellum-specific peptidoglycan hydrolase FlgJ